MPQLPIVDIFAPLITAFQQHSNVLLMAPPGAGKSTHLPLMLLKQQIVRGRIVLLEPRRIAAKTVAERLSHSLNELTGITVGYRMRGEQKVSQNTRIEVVTDGILTRIIQADPQLEGIDLVIFDEFHERNLQADLALALLLDVQKSIRPDLKILIMSATLDDGKLSELLPSAPLIVAEGRGFPITRHFLPLANNTPFVVAIAAKIREILSQHLGSLLVFLPGEAEIRQVNELLSVRCPQDTDIRPLYGTLPLTEQLQGIQPALATRRKVVLATNIAETSLTIEGIQLVLDSALEKVSRYDARTGQTLLEMRRISQSSMVQRAGRAGRLAPGICWHLLSYAQAERAPRQTEAEILRTDLSGLMLQLRHWGCQQPEQLDWLDPPPLNLQREASKKLQRLGALTEKNELTHKGRVMAELATDPEFAAVLVKAQEIDTANAAFTAGLIVAIMEQPDRQRGLDFYCGFNTPSKLWLKRARQWQQRLQKQGGVVQDDLVLPLLLSGFSSQLARRRSQDNRYQLANGQGAKLPVDSPMQHYDWLLVLRYQLSQKSAEAVIYSALPIDIDQIMRQYPEFITQRREVEWDEIALQLKVYQRSYLGKLIIKTVVGHSADGAEAQLAMLNWIKHSGIQVLPWTDKARQLQQRIGCASVWLAEEKWPSVDDSSLMNQLEQWLLPSLEGITTGKSLQEVDISQALLSTLSWQQRKQLETELPEYYLCASGQRFLIVYQVGQAPVLAIKMQQMYGQQLTPRIAKNRLTLQLSLLSPAGRPLQVTQDLAGFWAGAYKEVQKEMKGRYPKHRWPDNPGQSLPTRKPGK